MGCPVVYLGFAHLLAKYWK